ncbi:hypothetical protein ApAK_08055 [Thermoplasmatales archaeon AK]|nr:hypothetical protein [Thermoplasmatales archaeon AK]
MVLALAGWLRRHSVSEDKAVETVRALIPNERTPGKTRSSVRETYQAKKPLTGLPTLLDSIRILASEGKISPDVGTAVERAVSAVANGSISEINSPAFQDGKQEALFPQNGSDEKWRE